MFAENTLPSTPGASTTGERPVVANKDTHAQPHTVRRGVSRCPRQEDKGRRVFRVCEGGGGGADDGGGEGGIGDNGIGGGEGGGGEGGRGDGGAGLGAAAILGLDGSFYIRICGGAPARWWRARSRVAMPIRVERGVAIL
eukprot:6866777-Prymnesium_polylepis.1